MQRPKSNEFEALLSEHGNSVWRLVVRILGNDGHDAADCFQQAFVELVLRQRQSNDIREARLLLSRIATARAIDAVRRRIRERGRSQHVDTTASRTGSRTPLPRAAVPVLPLQLTGPPFTVSRTIPFN